jgi:hypothetical protein
MTRNFFIMSSLLAILCGTACTRTNDNNPAPDPPDNKPTDTLPSDNKPKDTLLSKIVIWDSTDVATYGAYTREFIFDDQKRVKLFVTYDSDTNGVKLPNAKTDTSLQCFYNGNEKNIYRTIGWMTFPHFSTELFHFYNSNNQIVKDSFSFGKPGYYGSREYTYAADKLTVYDTYISTQLPVTHNRDTFLITNNDITTARFTSAPGVGGYNIFTITYDNKINPLSKLNIAALKSIDGQNTFDKQPCLSPGFSKNNMTQRISKDGNSTSGSTTTDNFQYTYNEYNLPVNCKTTSTTYTTSAGRLKYIYTH